ncbi:uncharacterized protein LOC121729098 [Aricia agestis]|uniref:uncharacterized protein LOC121729098 n=1 Tax=Aricia agestis TaxID=91739 RepID=UPI001C20C068|nr:uncharacterized protein LOC121729098 [Aricia agestis]
MHTVKRICVLNRNRLIYRSISVNQVGIKNEKLEDLKSWKEIPGPSSLPVIKQLLHFLPGGDLHKADINLAGELHAKYGPIVRLDGSFGSPNFVFLYDPDVIEYVLRNEDHLPVRPGFQSLVYFRNKNKPKDNPECPTGLVSDQGETWKKFRSTVNPVLLQPKTIRLYRTILGEVAEDMVARMRSKRNEKNMIEGKWDFEMNLWALESIGVVALGGRLNCLDPRLPEGDPAMQMIQVVHDIFDVASRLDFRPNLSRFFSTPMFKRAMELYEKQTRLKKHFIAKGKEELRQKQKANDEKGVLEKLLEIDENIAEIMASDMLFAGIDTSSNTVTATLYFLATNQDKQEKLREEILSNDEKQPYLKACLKESMRILPVASANLRQTTKDYNLLGYSIPKGTHLVFCHQVISNLDEQFPQASQFIPERWIVDRSDPLYYGQAHPFAHMPFGFGVRSCIGRRIAELEIQTLLAKVVQNFRVEWFGAPLRVQQKSLNYMMGPFNFTFKDICTLTRAGRAPKTAPDVSAARDETRDEASHKRLFTLAPSPRDSYANIKSDIMLARRFITNVLAQKHLGFRFTSVSATIDKKETENLKSWKEIPGPSSLPIIGQLHHFLPGGEFYNMGPEIGGILYKKYGPMVRLDSIFGLEPLIFVLDAETSAYVLRSENWLPVRAGFKILEYFRRDILKKTIDDATGLLTDHGEPWKKFRSTVNPILLHNKILKIYSPTLEEIADDMIARMRSKRNKDNILDCKFDEEMNLWSFESIALIALGSRLNSFDSNLPEDSPVKRLINNVHGLMDSFLKLDFRPSPWKYISTPTYRRAIKLLYEQMELNSYFINRAMKELKERNNTESDERGVLEKLMEIDENIAISMASDMLFAGIDTTATTITAALYLLANNPEKQSKLRSEIHSDDEKRTYTKACIKETLRMMPVVSGNLRKSTKEYNLMGYRIPKDMNLTFGHQFFSVSEEHFKRPNEFIPERWTTDKSDPLHYANAHPFAYSPFGFGVRSCIGRRIAELELEIFLAKLIKNFEVGWFGPPPKIRPATINYIAGPYNFTFKDV